MVQNLNGRLTFVFASPEKAYHQLINLHIRLSLLVALMGIFLLPNLAHLSSITPERLIDLTNRERASAGLNALTANPLLTQAAAAKGQAIIQAQAFSHTLDNKKFSGWIRDTGYNYSYAGENLAIDFITSEGIIEAWDNSLAHRENFLNPYFKEIGIAAVPGKFHGQDTTVVVQMFGAPPLKLTQPLASAANLNYLNANQPLSNLNFTGSWFYQTDNLLTNTVAGQEQLPYYSNKIALNGNYDSLNQLNKFIVQSQYYFRPNNFLAIFSFLTLLYLLLFLYYYYFRKISRLASA